jgi:S-adenosylmethionine synthetase
MRSRYTFISESVTEGHPDKLCDQISDAIVGRTLRQDPQARVVAECAVSTSIVFLSVKTRGHAHIDVAETAREVIRRVGYTEGRFDARSCSIMTSIDDIGVPAPRGTAEPPARAEDQATVFGFACRQTPAFMPLPIWLAHRLARRLSAVRRSGELPYLAPDGKTQVGVEFEGVLPVRIQSVTLVASQRSLAEPTQAKLERDLMDAVIAPVFAEEPLRPDAGTRLAINPEGPFAKGGPSNHAGLTGRKNAVDTYGGFARHGGAALSGKDASRVDKVGAYAARYAAKNVVAAGLADQCEVALSYSIGLALPASVQVFTMETGRIDDDEIGRRLERAFDFSVAAIDRDLRLGELAKRDTDGFWPKLAAYGHVGRTDLDLPWERLDRVDALRAG